MSDTTTPIKTETIPINKRPKIGEKFNCYTMAKSGNFYMTVINAERYNKINTNRIDVNCFDDELIKSGKYFNSQTGEILAPDGIEHEFVLVSIETENIDAVSAMVDLAAAYIGLDPKLYSDGFCNEYDFSVSLIGITPMKKSGADDMMNLAGTGVDYFSLKNISYDDYYRSFLLHLEPGEKISFEIGKFIPKEVTDKGMIYSYGGNIGDDLISRCILNFSCSQNDTYVELNLEK